MGKTRGVALGASSAGEKLDGGDFRRGDGRTGRVGDGNGGDGAGGKIRSAVNGVQNMGRSGVSISERGLHGQPSEVARGTMGMHYPHMTGARMPGNGGMGMNPRGGGLGMGMNMGMMAGNGGGGYGGGYGMPPGMIMDMGMNMGMEMAMGMPPGMGPGMSFLAHRLYKFCWDVEEIFESNRRNLKLAAWLVEKRVVVLWRYELVTSVSTNSCL